MEIKAKSPNPSIDSTNLESSQVSKLDTRFEINVGLLFQVLDLFCERLVFELFIHKNSRGGVFFLSLLLAGFLLLII